MLDENHFIPFQAGSLPTGPWLVFAPHSDDETFGMGGTLLLAREQKIETGLIILTDGALGGDNENLTKIRKQETRQIADILNINSLEFWQNPDRGLTVNSLLVDRIIDSIITLNPQSIFFPAVSEFHPDHRITAFLVWKSMMQTQYRGEIFSYEIGSQQQPVNLLIDISDVFEEKHQLMKLYKSQLAENNYDDMVKALNKSRTFTLAKNCQFAEAFYQFDNCNQDLDKKIQECFRIYLNP